MKIHFVTPTRLSLINLTTIGDSEKREDDSKLGQFSSGQAYATALLLRDEVGLEGFMYQQKKKFFFDLRHYFCDDPHLYKEGLDGVNRRCVPEHEQVQILQKCHSEAYGGHHAGDRTAHKVLQSGFYWPTLFKDARKIVLSCDECQRIGNISKCREMPMNYTLVIEPFDVRGFDYMGPFPNSNGYTHILVAVDYVT